LRLDRVALEAHLEALNVTDAAFAFNFGNPFSGTHFGPPRTFALKLRLSSIDPGAAAPTKSLPSSSSRDTVQPHTCVPPGGCSAVQ
jgi:hypothetical protein